MKTIFTTLLLLTSLAFVGQTSITPSLTSSSITNATTSINSTGFSSNWNFPLNGTGYLTASVTTQSLYFDSVEVSFDYSFTSNNSAPHYYEISVNSYSLTVSEFNTNLIGSITQTVTVNCGNNISINIRSNGGYANANQSIVVSNLLLNGFNSCVAGINSINNLNVDFYSVSNSIIIKNNPGVKIDVFNLSGQLIYSNETSYNKVDLNVPNGLYLVKLSKDNQYSTKKVYISN